MLHYKHQTRAVNDFTRLRDDDNLRHQKLANQRVTWSEVAYLNTHSSFCAELNSLQQHIFFWGFNHIINTVR